MNTETTKYALFHEGKQVSKAHSSDYAVMVEAFEIGAVVTNHADFGDEKTVTTLANGYEIKNI